jgi:hypothetical protein
LKVFNIFLKLRGYRIEKAWPEIYTVKGDILPVQLIDSRELSAGENVWLKELNDRLEAAEIRRITEAVQ